MFAGIWAKLRAKLGASIVDQTCPYCFDTYRLSTTPFRCTNPRCPTKERDEVRARVWAEGDPRGCVLPSTGQYREAVRCPSCNQECRTRLCPLCHMELPHTTGQFRNLIIAVIGAKEAGKSHYIAVLIEHFRKRLGPELSLLLEPLDDRTIKRYREAFHAPVFVARTVIRGTISALADNRVQMPLVYSLTASRKGLRGSPTVKAVVTLVFFDTAGEDLDADDRMSVVNKYIYRADGIILLLDPLQLGQVRAPLASSTLLPIQNTETSEILQRVTKLIRGGRGLTAAQKVATPIAVAFSKFDAVEPLVDSQLQLFRDADHRRGYDVADFNAVNAEMQSLLSDWDSRVVQQQVETHYDTYGFFGLTALGCSPLPSGAIPRVAPRRVEDPFMWLLHRHGVIPVAKGAK